MSIAIIRLSAGGGGGGGEGLFKTRPSRGVAYSKVRKIRCKGPKKRFEVLKNELDKMAIHLNCMKLEISVII